MKVFTIPNHTDGSPYLTRLTLITLLGWSLKLHIIHRSDSDREPHCHPWSFWTLILAGGYTEHLMDIKGGEWRTNPDKVTTSKWHGPWSLRYCKAPYVHRLVLPVGDDGRDKPCVTLVVTSPKWREWGFYCKQGHWLPHFKFTEKPNVCEDGP